VPELAFNLFSVSAVVSHGYSAKFISGKCVIRSGADGKLIGIGYKGGDNLYHLKCENSVVQGNALIGSPTGRTWHFRMGHLNAQYLDGLPDVATGINLKKGQPMDFCEDCVKAKMHRTPAPKESMHRASNPGDLIHSDVCGPMSTESLGGSKYFISFVDDYTRFCTVYFSKRKSEAFEKFREFEMEFSNQFGRKIKKIRTDNGGEFFSKGFENHLKKRGIIHEHTIPDSPFQNGVAERKNRTLCEGAKSMLFHARLPKTFWAEAISTATTDVLAEPLRRKLPPLNFGMEESLM
jgi:transposase InsO family protein